ncbi:MAG: hypothetical protein QF642_03385 [Myxococcota bacterium]|jgi:hypothetical protein|nr:hypothetical protein [Myxococcota bacterium]
MRRLCVFAFALLTACAQAWIPPERFEWVGKGSDPGATERSRAAEMCRGRALTAAGMHWTRGDRQRACMAEDGWLYKGK